MSVEWRRQHRRHVTHSCQHRSLFGTSQQTSAPVTSAAFESRGIPSVNDASTVFSLYYLIVFKRNFRGRWKRSRGHSRFSSWGRETDHWSKRYPSQSDLFTSEVKWRCLWIGFFHSGDLQGIRETTYLVIDNRHSRVVSCVFLDRAGSDLFISSVECALYEIPYKDFLFQDTRLCWISWCFYRSMPL